MFQEDEGLVDQYRNDSGSGRGVQCLARERGEGRLKRLPGICWRDRGQSLKRPTVYRSSLKSGVAGITRRRYMTSVRRVYLLVRPLEKGENVRVNRIKRPATGVYSEPTGFSPTDWYKASQGGASAVFMKSPGKFPGLFNSPARKNWMEIAEEVLISVRRETPAATIIRFTLRKLI